MPTHPLPPGTRNGTINAPVQLWQEIGRLASIEGRSVSGLTRELFTRRLEEAKARGVQLYRDARQLVLPLSLCLLVCAGFAAVTAAAIIGASEARRPAIRRIAGSVRGLKHRTRRESDLET